MFEDKVLIWQYNRGKTRVLHRIYAKYKDDLMTLASALLYDRNSAEDVVHEVFYGVYQVLREAATGREFERLFNHLCREQCAQR